MYSSVNKGSIEVRLMSSMLFVAQRLCQYGITALNSFSEHQALALAYMEVTSTVLLHGPVEYEPYEPPP